MYVIKYNALLPIALIYFHPSFKSLLYSVIDICYIRAHTWSMNISVYLSAGEVEMLDNLREDSNLSRSAFIKSVVFDFSPGRQQSLEARVKALELSNESLETAVIEIIGDPSEFTGPRVAV